jgi:hypothetical protein
LELVVEVTDRWANELSEALVAAVTGSAELFARSPWATNLGIARPFRRPWSWSGPSEDELAHLDDGLGPGLAGRALGHRRGP